MEKILFLLDFYYPKASPNGICVHLVSKELQKKGYQIHVIAYKRKNESNFEIYEDVQIHRIRMRLFYILREYGENHIANYSGKIIYKLAKGINKIAKLFYLPWFPMASAITVNRYFQKAVKLHKLNIFSCAISLFNPEDTLFAGKLLKEKFPDLQYGAYILDSLIYLSGKKKLPLFLRDRLSWKFEKMVYENADMVYNMETHKIHHSHKKYDPYRNKMTFLDIPLFLPDKKPVFTHNLYEKDKRHLTYMGTLFKGHRNPEYLVKLFQLINMKGNYHLHFYSRGDCEDNLVEYQNQSNGTIHRYGYVAHGEIDNIIVNSDYLINLGVSNSTALSSKIFDFMSKGKPVIHFYYHDDDVCLPYFDKYKLSLMIKMDETILNQNAERLEKFLIETYNKSVDSAFLAETFKTNTPHYTAYYFDMLAKGNFKEPNNN